MRPDHHDLTFYRRRRLSWAVLRSPIGSGNLDDAIVFGAGCCGTQRVRGSRRRPASRRHSRTQRRRRPSPVVAVVPVVRLFLYLPPPSCSIRIFHVDEASAPGDAGLAESKCISLRRTGRPTSRCNQTPAREGRRGREESRDVNVIGNIREGDSPRF